MAATEFPGLALGAAGTVGALSLIFAAFLLGVGSAPPTGQPAVDTAPMELPPPPSATPQNLADPGDIEHLMPHLVPLPAAAAPSPPAPVKPPVPHEPAPPADPDATFIAAVQRDGVTVLFPARLIANAHRACELLSEGMSPDQAVDALTPVLFGRSRPVMAVVVAEAVPAYCPGAGSGPVQIR
jgi:serine/threonine protein kinase, bacterial